MSIGSLVPTKTGQQSGMATANNATSQVPASQAKQTGGEIKYVNCYLE